MTSFAVVVAADEAGGIGRDGGLPWHLPGDLAHFRRLTTGTVEPDRENAILMGRRTWDSIPTRFRPLRDRLNVVITRNPELALPEGVLRAGSFEAGLAAARRRPSLERVFVIGGAAIYQEALRHPGCGAVYLTRVAGTFACDTFLPPLSDELERVESSQEHVDNGVAYRFERWRRRAGDGRF